MTTVYVKEKESFESALRRFKKKVEESGILQEVKARQEYEKPSSKRKREKDAARRRHERRHAAEREIFLNSKMRRK